MKRARERDIIESFVSMASTLARGYDIVDLLGELTEDCARLLDVATAGLLLADQRGVLHVLAASSDRTRDLETFQLQRDEGPCRDCYQDGAPVLVADLDQEVDRWPLFVPRARAAGFASVHALPMRLTDHTLGTLGLFGTSPGALNDDDLRLGQALADVATVALLQRNDIAETAAVNDQLQSALTSRVILEQAKGLLAQLGDSDMTQAFAALRHYARDHNQRLSDVAQALVTRSLSASTLLEHVAARGTRHAAFLNAEPVLLRGPRERGRRPRRGPVEQVSASRERAGEPPRAPWCSPPPCWWWPSPGRRWGRASLN